MTLRALLERVPAGRVLVRTPTARLTCEEALNAVATPPELRGARVGVWCSSPLTAVPHLVALDGWVGSIALLSPASSEVELSRLRERGIFDVLVGDRVTGSEDLPAVAGTSDEPTAWILTTSGTTGEPKAVRHSLASLTRTTKIDVERGATQRWGFLYDHTRFAGFQVVLQSTLSGATLLAPSSALPLTERVAFLASGGCTHLSATPTLWRRLMMTPGFDALPLEQATLGGEIADQPLLTALGNAFPEARVAHIYASTEAGVGFSVSDRRAGFPLEYVSRGVGRAELEIRDGRLFIRQAVDAQGNPTGDAWLDTGDAVRVDGDRVYFLGRAAGAINVGGNKIYPEVVERALLEDPLVAGAHVAGRRNPIMGQLVVASVELSDAGRQTENATTLIRQHAIEKLGRVAAPAMVTVVESISTNAAGKVERTKP